MGIRAFRHTAAASRQRGLPPIGLELEAPDEIELTPIASGETLLRCRQHADGKTIGELEISLFAAALLIDREGSLADKACTVAEGTVPGARVPGAVAVSFPEVSGYRADVEPTRAHGYIYVFTFAPADHVIQGGALVVVRTSLAEWPAADAIIASLRLVTKRGITSGDASAGRPGS